MIVNPFCHYPMKRKHGAGGQCTINRAEYKNPHGQAAIKATIVILNVTVGNSVTLRSYVVGLFSSPARSQ